MTRVEEYFARQELEVRRKRARERAETMRSEDRSKVRTLHFMKCPKCGMDLQTFELQGVNVDHCPACMGAWFDRGEIERLLDRGAIERVMSVFR